MGGEREGVSRGGERNAVDPARGVVQELAAHGVKWEALSPGGGLRTLIDALDERGEDASVAVGGAGGEEHRVGVPGDGGDGGADGLLDVLRHPPVVFLLKVADGDEAGAGADSELGLGGGPADAGGGAVDAEEHEGGLPAFRRGLPDVGVAVYPCGLAAWSANSDWRKGTLRARHDLAALGCDVDTCDGLVVAGQLILQRVLVARALVQIDNVLTGDGEGLAVGGEGVVRDGVVEEVVDFWGGHCEGTGAIGDSLLLQCAAEWRTDGGGAGAW